MDTGFILTFLFAAALGSYLQSVTGFALGLVVVAMAAITGGTSIAITAAALSIMAICNALVLVPKMWRHTSWSGTMPLLFGLAPGLVAGLLLLDILSARHAELLQLLVGLLVLVSGGILFMRPQPREQGSSAASRTFVGIAAGILSGLFSTSGPPLVIHYYRQPIPVATIRATLISIFALLACSRLVLVTAQGQLDALSVQAALLALPVVTLTSWLSVKYPPKLSDLAIRRLAFALLTAIGVSTIWAALRGLV
ncbi:MAG TPA: TSUP family transporter [Gammaproteobacteria bacterium]|nr:TSUP family transporter [Gammaproteobacteria bacterium]